MRPDTLGHRIKLSSHARSCGRHSRVAPALANGKLFAQLATYLASDGLARLLVLFILQVRLEVLQASKIQLQRFLIVACLVLRDSLSSKVDALLFESDVHG
jgi:hypothetical protein